MGHYQNTILFPLCLSPFFIFWGWGRWTHRYQLNVTHWLLFGIYYISGTVLSLYEYPNGNNAILPQGPHKKKYITQCDSTMIGINKMSLLEKYIQDQLTSSGSCVRITEKIKEGKYTEIQILCRNWSGKLVKTIKAKKRTHANFQE